MLKNQNKRRIAMIRVRSNLKELYTFSLETSCFADNVMRANSIILLCFVFLYKKQTMSDKSSDGKCTFVVQCTLPICTWTVVSSSDTTLVRGLSPPAYSRGKEPARSIQISPVCSHPSPPASASQSRSYFVLLFCAASPGIQMHSTDFGRT